MTEVSADAWHLFYFYILSRLGRLGFRVRAIECGQNQNKFNFTYIKLYTQLRAQTVRNRDSAASRPVCIPALV